MYPIIPSGVKITVSFPILGLWGIASVSVTEGSLRTCGPLPPCHRGILGSTGWLLVPLAAPWPADLEWPGVTSDPGWVEPSYSGPLRGSSCAGGGVQSLRMPPAQLLDPHCSTLAPHECELDFSSLGRSRQDQHIWRGRIFKSPQGIPTHSQGQEFCFWAAQRTVKSAENLSWLQTSFLGG